MTNLGAIMKDGIYKRPILKYAGSKYELLTEILPLLGSGQRLIEPFCGSCVVGLNARFDHVWANDINPDLIGLYQQVNDPAFLPAAEALFHPTYNKGAVFNTMKAQFNRRFLKPIDRAATFLYFNWHCFNGLCRYNAKGEFNVSFGRYRSPRFPREKLRDFQAFTKRATFTCQDWETVMKAAQPGDVVYCDPPYVPLTKTASFTGYAGRKWGLDEARRLDLVAAEVAGRGVTVVLSNANVPTTLECFPGHRRTLSVEARRSISCKPESRGNAQELLLVY